MVELIENRGIQLGSLCTAHKEESLRITQAVRTFIEQYQLVSSEDTNMSMKCFIVLPLSTLAVHVAFERR